MATANPAAGIWSRPNRAMVPGLPPLRQALLLGVLAFLAWRITALGVANIQVAALDSRGEAAVRRALDWYPGQAEALYRLGVSLLREDVGRAEALLQAAYLANPTDPAPLQVLAGVALAREDSQRADLLIQQVDALRPVNPQIQRDLGRYWLERGRGDLAFHHWSRAIQANPGLAPGLFETFRALLKDPGMGEAFAAITRDPPAWWLDFFADTATRGQEVETLRLLYRLRRDSVDAPLTLAERQQYLQRLLREGLYREAYLAWVNSLNAAQRQQLGYLFNGGFEVPLTGLGFDWRIAKSDRVEIGRAAFEGDKRQALRVRFRLMRTPFEHLSQPLLLSPGAYEVAGTYRGVELMTDEGFRWVARCRVPDHTLLGESERIFSAETWTSFRFQIEVPESCVYQELRLVSAAGPTAETTTDGELWFDELSLQRIDGLSPQARARIEAARWEEQGPKPGAVPR
ncbi:MAG: hypothetical protein IT487_12080 [Chromatiaceae bacterium]|nr:hypothetical protein [Chromatiaceae bacterium]